MKTAFILLAAVCTLALAGPQRKFKIENKDVVSKQKDILLLLNYVNQPSYYKKFSGAHFVQESGKYTHPEHITYFLKHHEEFLPQGQVFSVFNPVHLKQAISLFKIFYYAKDYETFYQNAVYARNHVNEGMFVYALSVAVLHRNDMSGVVLPAIYEVYPHYFFNTEVIRKAQQFKQHFFNEEDNVRDESYRGYTIHANYSGEYLNVHPEQSMSYFYEDVGLNAHYYYFNLHYPFWMNSEEFDFVKDRRGEQYYYQHQQLLARAYLERLSNDFGEIPHFSYDHPIETGYAPSLQYTNGLHFPSRPNHAHLYYHGVHGEQSYPAFGNYSYSYTYVKDYERRIRDAIDRGYIYTPEGKTINIFTKEGFELLGDLIESNADSPNGRFYGALHIFARHLLGYSYYPLDEYKLAPSALEHFETSLRDPMFYQLYKRILSHYHQYQNYLPHYNRKDLKFQGVQVEDISVDSLTTFFDYFYSDISNAVYVNEQEFLGETFEIRARQYRLNHKPFNYKIHVNSDKATEAFVKVFIGPKYDEYGREISINENRLNFVEFDRFHYSLQSGKNVIQRNSRQSFFVSDRTTYKSLYQKVMTAHKGGEGFHIDDSETYFGIPSRFLLPKGKVGGQTFQFYVIVSPFHGEHTQEVYPEIGAGSYYIDNHYTLGYPFDRYVESEHEFLVPNSYFKDVVVYHKRMHEDVHTVHHHN